MEVRQGELVPLGRLRRGGRDHGSAEGQKPGLGLGVFGARAVGGAEKFVISLGFRSFPRVKWVAPPRPPPAKVVPTQVAKLEASPSKPLFPAPKAAGFPAAFMQANYDPINPKPFFCFPDLCHDAFLQANAANAKAATDAAAAEVEAAKVRERPNYMKRKMRI